MTTHNVELLTNAGNTESANIEIIRTDKVTLRLESPSIALIEVAASDVFAALCAVREKLEGMGAWLLCQGAAEQVYPSRMAREMGGGEKAYSLTMGKQARAGDLVPLFELAPREAVATVAAQRAFYERWLKSLGQPAGPPPASLNPALVHEAKRHPNGWVYEIDGQFRDDEPVPPEAIKGAWKVDGNGRIVGDFIPNGNFKPKLVRDLMGTKVVPRKES